MIMFTEYRNGDIKMLERDKLEEQIREEIYDEGKEILERKTTINSITNEYIKANGLQKFYKYRTINEYSLKNIKNNTIWLSTADTFNDVYDGVFSFTDGNSIDEITRDMNTLIDELLKGKMHFVKKILKNAINKFTKDKENSDILCEMYTAMVSRIIQSNQSKTLVGSFCENYNSIYMWGVYGDNGRGVCLEYDYNEIKNAIKNKEMKFYPVLYGRQYPKVRNLFWEYMHKCEAFETNYLALMKSEEWKQENEWRIIGKTNDCVGTNLNIKPSRIYFGPNICKESIEKVLEVSEHKIECVQLKKSLTDFTLDKGKIYE